MKVLRIFMILCVLCYAAGCSSVQKKFTRKKPEKREAAAVYLQEGPYQKQFTNDYYYKIHYTQWSSWQSELLLQLGGNRKKVKRCAQEALGHLSDMKRYLKEDKQGDLLPWVDDMKRITQKIESGSYSSSDEAMMKTDLEKIQRIVSSNFYYDKVKDHVLADKVDL